MFDAWGKKEKLPSLSWVMTLHCLGCII